MKVIVVDDMLEFNKRMEKNITQVLIEENLDIQIIPFLNYNKELKKIIKLIGEKYDC